MLYLSMKNIRKWMTLLCCFFMFFSSFTIVEAAPSQRVYDRNEAVMYAKNHWDDGVGVCDQFVKDCLKAGGVDIKAGGVGPLMDALVKVGYGEKIDIVLDDNGYHIHKDDNPKLSIGDPLFIYCEDCDKMLHSAFVGLFDDNGNAQVYGHNPAWDAENPILYLGKFHHKVNGVEHRSGYKFYAVHMTDDSSSHKHDFSEVDSNNNPYFEKDHPHKMYAKCSCGVSYYLGWNAKVSMCTQCNPPLGPLPVVTVSKSITDGAIVEWSTVEGATGYNVHRAKSKNGTYYKIGTNVQSTSFVNASVEKGQDYYYKVEAIKTSGNVMSEPAHFIIADSTGYVKPVVTVDTFEGKPRLTWDVAPGIVRYEVYRANSLSGTYNKVFETNLGVYKHVSAENDKTYYYKVKALYIDNSEKTSDVVTYTMPHVHSYTSKVTDPKCEDKGYTTHTCKCGDSYKDTFVKELGHKFVNYVSDNNATTEKDGTKTAKCERCDVKDTITDVGSKLPKPQDPSKPSLTSATRIFGNNRYETAFKTADTLKATLGVDKFSTVIVANGTNFADALAGSYLAAKKDAPILMTDKGSKNVKNLQDYIKANVKKGGTVYILGGTAALPSSIDKGLSGYNVERLAGKDRYETNLLILKAAGVTNEEIIVATGTGFADSLSASATGRPLLLVGKSLNAKQKDFLASLNGNKMYIAGGTAAVSSKVEKELKSYGSVKRLAGNSRYDTSVLIAETFFNSPKHAVVALGTNFPDGLSGGPLAYTLKSPLLLSASQKGSYTTISAYTNSNNITSGYVLGGPGLLNNTAVKAIFKK